MTDKPFAMSVKVVVHDAQGRVLVIQRSAASSHNAGMWDLPGGKVDPGEDFTTALEREVAEETGLTIRLTRLAGSAQSEAPARTVVYLIMAAERVDGDLRLSEEHVDHRWVTLEKFRTIDLCHQFIPFARSYQPS